MTALGSVEAAAKLWVGTGGGEQRWNLAANWSPAGIPTVADDVTIPAGNGLAVVVRGTAVARTVDLNRTLRIVGDLGAQGVLSVERGVTNRGEIRLETERADRDSTLTVTTNGTLVNLGLLRVSSAIGGRRFITAAIQNAGEIRVDAGIEVVVDNGNRQFVQTAGTVQSDGTFTVLGGRFRAEGGSFSGQVRLRDVEVTVTPTFGTPSTLFLIGEQSFITANASAAMTLHGTADIGANTTLRFRPGAVNEGRIQLGSERSDRRVFVELGTTFTNGPTGVIEVVRAGGGDRHINGRLVNQGRMYNTNLVTGISGTYVVDGGTIEGNYAFEGIQLVTSRDAPTRQELRLLAATTVDGDVLPNLQLRVMSDVGANGRVSFSRASINRGTVILGSDRSDRVTRLVATAGSGLENRGVLQLEAGSGGGRVIEGAFNNAGDLLVDAGVQGIVVNDTRTMTFSGGRVVANGSLLIQGGRVRVTGGALAGDVRAFDAATDVESTFAGPAVLNLLGSQSSLVKNASRNMTLSLTTDVGNQVILTTQAGAVNLGRIELGSGHADRFSRVEFGVGFTNRPSGVIEAVAGFQGERRLNGRLVNQGWLKATNQPCIFTGTYESDGGIVLGDVSFYDTRIVPLRETPVPVELKLLGAASALVRDNLPRLELRVIGDVSSNARLTFGSNVVNGGQIRLETTRSDRSTSLAGADGKVRNGPEGTIVVAAPTGGVREIASELQNQGRIVLRNALQVSGLGARHVNAGLLELNGNELSAGGLSLLNAEQGWIRGSGRLSVAGVNFTNSGVLSPGTSPGKITVAGNYRQSDQGVLDIELAGVEGPGVGHDFLEVTGGTATLQGGTLVTRTLGSFVPAANASFRILSSSGSRTGQFARFPYIQVTSNRYLEPIYGANTVDLAVRTGSISNRPPEIAVGPEPVEADQDGAAEFRVIANGTAPFSYQWRRNGAHIPGATSDRYSLARVGSQDLGQYDVVVSNPYGTATSSAARLAYKGTASQGCTGCDFGDASDTYGTSLANDGARHPNDAGIPGAPFVGLGPVVDLEADSLGNTSASVDDGSPPGQPDDEDGVTFVTGLTAGNQATVQVLVRRSGYEFAFLTAWVDFRQDGVFGADDLIIPTVEVQPGVNVLPFTVPANAVSGPTVSRFRLIGVNSANDPRRLVGPKGAADNGEVEDHPVTITGGTTGGGGNEGREGLDFGDAPDSYRTTLAANGARHQSDFFATNNPAWVVLGSVVDLETNATPSVNLSTDDAATATRADDEDGVRFLDALRPGQPTRVEVVVRSQNFNFRFLNAWVDFGGEGTFTNATDKVFSGLSVTNGTNVLVFTVPVSAVPGTTASRWRVTAAGTSNAPVRTVDFLGEQPVGEVEDHLVSIQSPEEITFDWGDAPENQGTFATTQLKNGARHRIVAGFYLGKQVDAENDGKPGGQARGDDNANDDEDGVVFNGAATVGGMVTVEVTASAAGKLDGWIDFNANRSWADAGEQVFVSRDLVSGINTLTVAVPAAAVAGEVFARFRFSSAGGLGTTGEAPDGEVEDYKVAIEPSAACTLSCTGTNFWLAFPGNQFPDPANPLVPQLRILGTAGTTVTVSIPGLGSNLVATIAAGGIANVVLPVAVDLGDLNDGILNRGIRVSSGGVPVSVYAISRVPHSTDGYLALPVEVVGTEYVVGAHPNLHVGIPELSGTQFAVTATRSNTTVTITPSFETGVRVGRVPYTLTLTNAGDCYQLRNTGDAPADLTGTWIEADQPIAVFGGHQCTDVHSSSVFFCDHLVEQMPPVNRLGTEFFSTPFATRTNGDTLRVVAARDLTTLTVDGNIWVLTNRGDVFTSLQTNATWVVSDKPVYAAQYASSSDIDGVTNADPFMVTLPGRSLFTAEHTFVTAGTSFPAHYINVVAPSSVASLTLDGVALNPAFTAIGTSGFRYTRLAVTQGRHTLTATRPIGVVVYGWSEYESYGWPACLFFGDTTPPVLSGASNRVVRALGANDTDCTVALPDLRTGVTVTDNCSLPLDVIISQSPPIGTRVGVGTNVVTLSTRDSSGNLGRKLVEYVVTDPRGATGAYVLRCPDLVRAACTAGAGSVVRFDVSGLRGCTPVAVRVVPASGSLFPKGVTEVVAQIVEAGAVRAECRFNVRVECRKRFEIKVPTVPVGEPIRELILDFDPGENVVEVADSVHGPWVLVPDARPGMAVRIAQERGKFYRIR